MSGKQLDFAQSLHASTKRDYLARVVEHDKASCADIAGQFGADYWDGERHYGYGGYRYDGRWQPFAQRLVEHFAIQPGDHVLDIGCGKGYLLYELFRLVPGIRISGIDISDYAIAAAKPEIRSFVRTGSATALPYADASVDVVLSLGTLHNLELDQLWSALTEIERVGRGTRKYVMVESYRNEREKANLLYWQLTCRSFYNVNEWAWLYAKTGYSGDFDFIFFT